MSDTESNDQLVSAGTAWRVVSVGAGALAGVAARRAVLAIWPGASAGTD